MSQGSLPFYEKKITSQPQRMRYAHFHEQYELYYLKRGKTKYVIGSEIFLLSPGDLIFIPRNTFHKSDNSDSDGVERVLFTFDDSFFKGDGDRILEALCRVKYIHPCQETRESLQYIMECLEREEAEHAVDFVEMQRLYLRQLLILLRREIEDTPMQSPSNHTYQPIESVAKYISEHYDADLSLSTLAQRFGMSNSYLSRYFKQAMSVSLSEYIMLTRISAAERLLRSTDYTVTEVAIKCGYNDSNYFASIFKQVKGISPKKYAMKHR